MTSLQNSGNTISYDKRGNAPPAILFSRSGASNLAWRELFLETLAKRLTVISIDARGTGYSSPATAEFSLNDLASDGYAVLEAEGIEKAVAIGASMGGAVAQEFALSYPNSVDALVLLGTLREVRTL